MKAAHYYTILDNGLERPWRGRVWLNPPYARGWIDLFAAKMASAYRVRRDAGRYHADELHHGNKVVADGGRRLRMHSVFVADASGFSSSIRTVS